MPEDNLKKQRRTGKRKARDADAQLPDAGTRLLGKLEVIDRVGRTFPTIWGWMREGFFPRARNLDGRPVWIESEVEKFITNLPTKEYLGDKGYVPSPQARPTKPRRASKNRAA